MDEYKIRLKEIGKYIDYLKRYKSDEVIEILLHDYDEYIEFYNNLNYGVFDKLYRGNSKKKKINDINTIIKLIKLILGRV